MVLLWVNRRNRIVLWRIFQKVFNEITIGGKIGYSILFHISTPSILSYDAPQILCKTLTEWTCINDVEIKIHKNSIMYSEELFNGMFGMGWGWVCGFEGMDLYYSVSRAIAYRPGVSSLCSGRGCVLFWWFHSVWVPDISWAPREDRRQVTECHAFA